MLSKGGECSFNAFDAQSDGNRDRSCQVFLEKTVRGPVTKILRKLGCGFVLTETGDEIFFGSYALDGVAIDQLQEGQWVEFELYDLEMGRAIVARLHPESSTEIENSRCA